MSSSSADGSCVRPEQQVGRPVIEPGHGHEAAGSRGSARERRSHPQRLTRPSAPVAPRRARRRPAPVRSNAGALAAEQPELAGRDHDHHERPASLGIGDAPIDSTRRTPGEVEADTQAERGGSAGQTDRGHEEGPAAGGKPSSTRRNAR